MPQPAWLIYGPPGCGKTTWILAQVKAERKKLYHWNARTDRTLREGRQSLHRQVRSQEPLIVWIEGADDLTPEAQAFLRRILETASPHVTCALEVRKLECMAEPIQSRCVLKRIQPPENGVSHRQNHIRRSLLLPDDDRVPVVESPPTTLSELREARLAGADPYIILLGVAKGHRLEQEALKRVAQGASPWIMSAWILSSFSQESE